jgi:tyrosine-specific transport protein
MLALPVSTGMAGFVPSLFLLIGYWIFMTFTAFLMLEVNLWMDRPTNLVSMAGATLGKGGAAVSWITYLFLLYSLTTAYIAGCDAIIQDLISATTGWILPSWIGTFPLMLLFAFFVYKGTRSVDLVNRLLMIGLAISYVMMLIFVAPYVKPYLLKQQEFRYLWLGISVVATSFGFHIIIPSLTVYFNRDIRQLKKAIFIGSLIPLVVYILWEFLALGIIPKQGPNSILDGYIQGANGASLLSNLLGSYTLAMTARFFSLFAIITSFLGVSLSLMDFLEDGLRVGKTRSGRLLLFALTFFPPVLFTLTNPRVFLSALEYAGAFGVVVLLGLLPALMVWRGRYHKSFATTYTAPGGKIALALTIAVSLAVIGVEIAIKTGFAPSAWNLSMQNTTRNSSAAPYDSELTS